MNQKERFLGTLLGEGADRFPLFDLDPDEETVEKWHREGLPRETSVALFFNLEIHYSVGLTIRSYPYFKKAAATYHASMTDPEITSLLTSIDCSANFLRRLAKENLGKSIEILRECGAGGWMEKYEKELSALS